MPTEPRSDQAYVESHESEYITPVDAVAAKARADVYNVEKVLHTSGVPLEQIAAAADLNAKNAKVEFEAKQAEDPIRRIINVLETSAVTDTDREIIAQQIQELEKDRSDWKEIFDSRRTALRMNGREDLFSHADTVKNAIGNHKCPTFTDYDIDTKHSSIFFEVLGRKVLKTTNEWGIPSKECLDKVLHGLGVLQPGEKTADLYKLPPADETNKGKPIMKLRIGKAENLQTNIPDTHATVFLQENRLQIGVAPEILGKIVAFPASV
jgi:hypothetical protein